MRKWIATTLVRLARRIYPMSEEVRQFYMDSLIEASITGQSTIQVKHVDIRPAAPNVGTQEKS